MKTQGFTGIAVLKVDVSKTYDRLKWPYIEWMLDKLGFTQLWVERITKCVRTISYSFIRDGTIFENVVPMRGVRQEDPISPYLYIICVDGLSGMIRMYEAPGLLHGCKIANGAPSVSHLLFAEDCYFFFQASQTEASITKDILKKYEKLSGQMIN